MSAMSSTAESPVHDDALTGTRSVAAAMLPVMVVVLVGFLIIGMAMPVLPLHVHQALGLSTFVVGVIAGAQFAAALLSRFWSGRYADTRGAKRAMTVGLLLAAVAGAIYMASLQFTRSPTLSVTILLIGRAILGWSESCIITGAREESPSFRGVIAAVRAPGLGLALGSVGFGAITTFIALLFAERHWSSAWIVFTSLSGAFIVGRLLFGHLPDRIGGARIAVVCVAVEAAGLALIWSAPSAMLVFIGAAVTGAGYSLVYPAFGVDAVRRAPPESHGLAMGAFTAFLDLALGIANPVL